MVFIHVKKIGNVKYYTLRISARKGDKVITKDLCNLGNDISKIKIEDLENNYSTEIRKSYRTIKKFLDSNHYEEEIKKVRMNDYFSKDQIVSIEAIKLHYNSKFLNLDKKTQEQANESFLINFAVNSTSIEGNTITLKEANKLFKEDIIPKDRTLREVNDLTNTKKVIEYLNEDKPKISLELIIKIHDLLLKDIDKRTGLRNHDIHIFGQPFKPTPKNFVRKDMEILMSWLDENYNKIYPLALVTYFHHKFESIHPFSDGNGRTGRVLMNYILQKLNYPPLVISRRFRKEYLDSMNKADTSIKKGLTMVDNNYRKLLDFMFSQYKLSYWDTFLY